MVSLYSTIPLVETLPIPQADRKRFLKQIDMGEQYQKIKRTGHCFDDADCITHCTIFGLSDSKRAEYYSNCNHTHTAHCPDCINISITLDEISQQIPKIGSKDFERDLQANPPLRQIFFFLHILLTRILLL